MLSLPDFIKRMVGFADTVQPILEATASAELSAAKIRIAALETELTEAQARQSSFDVTIKDLNTKVAAAAAQIQSDADTIKNLRAELDTARLKAENVIASQGLPPERLPALLPTGGSDTSKAKTDEQLLAELAAIAPEDGKARAEFIQKHIKQLRAMKT
jgi:septal ring factor EnvC (AmiA/AmiB activator)